MFQNSPRLNRTIVMTTTKHQRIEDIIVRDDASIRDALEMISINRLLAVCVVDKDNYLLGTVTDGDIRHGMLKGINLDISVRSIMSPKPLVVEEGKTEEEIYSLMVDTGFMIIPSVDSGGHLIDYYHFFETITIPPTAKNKLFLLRQPPKRNYLFCLILSYHRKVINKL